MTAFAVLATGNHFVLDLLGGLATIALSLLRRSAPERSLSRRLGAGFRRAAQPVKRRMLPAQIPRTRCHKVVTKSKTR